MPEKLLNKQARRIRGQFFTPEEVALFAWEMLAQIIPPGEFSQMQVIDPAAGEGIFLTSGVDLGLISTEQVTGVEIDSHLCPPPELASRWVFGDGLLNVPGLRPETFNLVIGNPPFGRGGKEGLPITRLKVSGRRPDRKSTRLNSSHVRISYAVFC